MLVPFTAVTIFFGMLSSSLLVLGFVQDTAFSKFAIVMGVVGFGITAGLLVLCIMLSSYTVSNLFVFRQGADEDSQKVSSGEDAQEASTSS